MARKYLGLRGRALNLAVATIAGLGFLLFGYDQGVMGSLLTLDTFTSTFPSMDVSNRVPAADRAHNSTIQGVAVSLYEVGCMFGAIATMVIGDKIGRRKTIFIGSILMIIGTAIQCSSFSLSQFIVGRIVTGFGNGFITATVPMWQSECAKAEARGQLVMVEGALITGGIALSYWIDFAFYFVPGQADWRFPIAFQAVFAIIVMCTVLELPESPRWLLKKGHKEEAALVFASLADVPADSSVIVEQVDEIKATLTSESRSSFREIFTFTKEKHFHRTMLAFWNQVMQQITGANLIIYYAGSIYENSIGLSPLNAKIVAACNGTEYFLASWVAFFTIERLGRRKLMIGGAAGQAVSMAILTGTAYLADQGNSKAGIAAAVFLFVFNTFFGIGWLGMTWLYPAEIVSLQVRAPANGLSTAGNWVSNFLVVMITPVAFNSIGAYTYLIFAAINAVMVPTVYFFYPETSGRSLEEIDEIFAHSNSWTPWDVVGIAKHMPKHHTEYIEKRDEEARETNGRRRSPFDEDNEKPSVNYRDQNLPDSASASESSGSTYGDRVDNKR
ncbi:general substrate transporter [Lipomyces tetrasporus]|uniref:General substrate transporter n=1 Tax=Lipomyces tetrasporus TaxID=54092 RepID=A0AAD7QN61_9ASCO|nr:general substrate transporter [Lipomyces tetrasporus]KAJ8098118.1 general substrate transporter [Lipomyces tetrasporus]